jgi:hypothetical protein
MSVPSGQGELLLSNPLLRAFIDELDFQCYSAGLAYGSLMFAANVVRGSASNNREQQQEIFLYVQSFLTHASIVSMILWPSRDPQDQKGGIFAAEDQHLLQKARRQRGKQLRQVLGGVSLQTLKDRRLRDLTPLTDSVVELWALTNPTSKGSRMLVDPDQSEERDALRHLDPISMTYSFLGEKFLLSDIATELARIHWIVAELKVKTQQ